MVATFWLLTGIIILIGAVEIIFRIIYLKKNGRVYQIVAKVPFEKMYVEPHPYLPFVYKKHFVFQKSAPANYPLNRHKSYTFDQVKTNNFRHLNGPRGDRDIEMPKPKGLFRINCLGESTTGNYISLNGHSYSYPMELEQYLQETFPQRHIEVNNCGQGGYTSAEIMIKFLLDTIDTQPDVVIIYCAYNDLQPSLTDGFQSDYSHSKRNLGEVYHLYKIASLIPHIPLSFWNYILNKSVLSQNIRYSLLSAIARNKARAVNEFKGITTYKRNIEHIIQVCQSNKIKVVLSTFCHYLYPAITRDDMHRKYHVGVGYENEAIKELAAKYEVALVDNDVLVPRDEKYFVDSIHFTPEGMQFLARNLSVPIIDYISMCEQTADLSKSGATF